MPHQNSSNVNTSPYRAISDTSSPPSLLRIKIESTNDFEKVTYFALAFLGSHTPGILSQDIHDINLLLSSHLPQVRNYCISIYAITIVYKKRLTVRLF